MKELADKTGSPFRHPTCLSSFHPEKASTGQRATHSTACSSQQHTASSPLQPSAQSPSLDYPSREVESLAQLYGRSAIILHGVHGWRQPSPPRTG
ncbi:hypothetical protein AAFF_G00436050 [Aldrovandia affinis]|uniref:Uncharacterized protein n=1 Tax=Aldrovandia affinis TaxID=143900 RepID=A0AAD7S7W6_9TELE|nr:hypothetical protein AAFF_G00436050 [Aldrovandia affinis]